MQLIIPKAYSYLAPLECELVRVGGLGDGGYVIHAADQFGIEVLLSLGISDDWSFEREIARTSPKCTVYGYDRTSGSLVFIFYLLREVLSSHRWAKKIKLLKKWLWLAFSFFFFWNGKHKFERKWIVLEKKNLKEKSIKAAFGKIPLEKKLGIKIDIEGNEYEIGDELVEQIRKRCPNTAFVVIEFHNISKNQKSFFDLTRKIQEHLPVAHVHANNFGDIGTDGFPEVIEITFSSSINLSETKKLSTPNGSFDKPCNPLDDDIYLVFSV